ncbi:MAG: ABC transporter ATP-binding protein [Brevibacterium sp.]|uniref:ABC transporter ATP-binding protein n=1 Tax=Brevibacterium sp. TaxID=1701 RepID=UPI002647A9F0|nr:ABC transporter ATP-binding protein [Brevibacterium sp.]MDN5805579.1 ABC transporter ATP-binding protein [Brevibacterium sp.]MDN5832372.1 ABC transporter ATP-binding protein [Brevibacterium sp.]MDN5876054.1 ABC transporter ATP-binding protein [Brevibacterium sp.]MDN6156359.1 ABC transporter ATP-binding protein [Brevibacterium sp.]MDN6174330.1 ABC transporter ATP-binding protein [Brevibacterium sp.]
MSESALTIRGLHYSYGAHHVVDGIDLDAASGSILGVLGPNGAGKSTTISLAVGTRAPDAGHIEIFGLDPFRQHEKTSLLAGVMLQDGGLPMSAKPLQVLRHLSSLYPNPLSVDELAEPLGLHEFSTRTIRRLSGGQKQRVALAAALIGRPRLVFLDEPCAGLDPRARAVVHDFIRELAAASVAVVLTTHDLAEAEELADEVVVIDRGRIIAQGAPEDLRSASPAGRRLTITVDHALSPAPPELLTTMNTIAPTSALGSAFVVDGDLESTQIAGLATAIAEAGLAITDIDMHSQSLADVFFELTGRPLR